MSRSNKAKENRTPPEAHLAWALHEASTPGWRTKDGSEVESQLRHAEEAQSILLSLAQEEESGAPASSREEEIREALERVAAKLGRLKQLKRELRLKGGPTFFGLWDAAQLSRNPYPEPELPKGKLRAS